MIIGDLAARLFYSALIFLVNGTASPEEVAAGYPPAHRLVLESRRLSGKGGYSFAGWDHIKKRVRRALVAGTALGRMESALGLCTISRSTIRPALKLVGPRQFSRRDDLIAA